MDKKRVLFVCTHNTARSLMAEAILRQVAGNRFDVVSGGLESREVPRETFTVLEEVGYDTSGLNSKQVDGFFDGPFVNYFISVCSRDEKDCPVVWPLGGAKIYWPVADPALVEGDEEHTLRAYREARDEIKARIDIWLNQLGTED
jgi:arsenate reductase